MTRRGRAFLAAAALLVVLIVVGMSLHVPYVTFSPGPVTDTLGSVDGSPLIQVTGHPTYPAKGKLQLTTVTETNQLDMVTAIKDWVSPHQAVVPEEIVKPPGQSEQQVQQQNAQEMVDSQESATAAAMNQLGVQPIATTVTVAEVPSGPSTGKLQVGDEIVAVDGTTVKASTDVATAVRKHKPGETVSVTYKRAGATHTVDIKTEESGGHAVVGVSTTEHNVYPFTVKIGLKNVGGPSAGLMFAMGIVEKLTPGDMTGGRNVAGTGTIDADGTVGPIGGIQQKVRGARDAGATIFFVPSSNCNEAKGNAPKDIRLLRVDNLKTAIDDLESLDAGKTDQRTC